ncbi:MAG: hypothetical protein IT462_04980 [Planctomycetes bacterium]|nr:hypothetical protein [Planctomycetota bacterium]
MSNNRKAQLNQQTEWLDHAAEEEGWSTEERKALLKKFSAAVDDLTGRNAAKIEHVDMGLSDSRASFRFKMVKLSDDVRELLVDKSDCKPKK